MDYLGVAFISALRQDHLYKLCDNVDIRVVQIALLQCTHSTGSSRGIGDGISGRRCLFQQVATDRVQASWIGKGCKLDCAKLRSVRLSRKSRRYNSIL